MNSVVELYEALATAPDERARARLIADAFERLEERYPHLPDLATQGHVRETELRLQKEIEQVRADLRETELRLKKEIEQVGADLRETELRLKKDRTGRRGSAPDRAAVTERDRAGARGTEPPDRTTAR